MKQPIVDIGTEVDYFDIYKFGTVFSILFAIKMEDKRKT